MLANNHLGRRFVKWEYNVADAMLSGRDDKRNQLDDRSVTWRDVASGRDDRAHLHHGYCIPCNFVRREANLNHRGETRGK